MCAESSVQPSELEWCRCCFWCTESYDFAVQWMAVIVQVNAATKNVHFYISIPRRK